MYHKVRGNHLLAIGHGASTKLQSTFSKDKKRKVRNTNVGTYHEQKIANRAKETGMIT